MIRTTSLNGREVTTQCQGGGRSSLEGEVQIQDYIQVQQVSTTQLWWNKEIYYSSDDQLGESNRDPRTHGKEKKRLAFLIVLVLLKRKEKKASSFACASRSRQRVIVSWGVIYCISKKFPKRNVSKVFRLSTDFDNG